MFLLFKRQGRTFLNSLYNIQNSAYNLIPKKNMLILLLYQFIVQQYQLAIQNNISFMYKKQKNKETIQLDNYVQNYYSKHQKTLLPSLPKIQRKKLKPALDHQTLERPQNTYKLKSLSLIKPNRIKDTLNQEQLQTLKNQIETTLKRMKNKIFVPHGASKRKNLQLVKRRRGAQLKSLSRFTYNNSLLQDHLNRSRQMTLDQKLHTQRQICSCTLQQGIYYG